jgi:hypothetical protein
MSNVRFWQDLSLWFEARDEGASLTGSGSELTLPQHGHGAAGSQETVQILRDCRETVLRKFEETFIWEFLVGQSRSKALWHFTYQLRRGLELRSIPSSTERFDQFAAGRHLLNPETDRRLLIG